MTVAKFFLLMPERLRRLEWLFERNPIYFVTANTQHRAKILAMPAVHKGLQSFAESGPNHGAWLGAYVLMPDHVHAFVALDARKISLSAWIKSLKNALSKALRESAIESPHWQKGFFDHVLRSAESFPKIGIMSARIPCEPVWFPVGKIGPTSANRILSNTGNCRKL